MPTRPSPSRSPAGCWRPARSASSSRPRWPSTSGSLTAGLHAALADARGIAEFQPRRATRDELRAWAQAARRQLVRAVDVTPGEAGRVLRELASAVAAELTIFEALPTTPAAHPGPRRLPPRAGPGRPRTAIGSSTSRASRSDRSRRGARMARRFGTSPRCSARSTTSAGAPVVGRSSATAARWRRPGSISTAGFAGRASASSTPTGPGCARPARRSWSDPELIRAFEIEKECYEFIYASTYLPSWLWAPTEGLRGLFEATARTAEAIRASPSSASGLTARSLSSGRAGPVPVPDCRPRRHPGLVRAARPIPAVPPDDRPVCRPRLGGDGPADPGRSRRRRRGCGSWTASRRSRRSRPRPGRRPPRVAGPRLQPAGAQPAARRAPDRRAATAAGCRPTSAPSRRCRASGRTRLERWRRSRSAEAVGAVDTNVRRVLGRIVVGDAGADPGRRAAAPGRCRGPARPGGDWTHALMDVGATVCRPRRTDCDACPARPWCAFAARRGHARPPRPTAGRARAVAGPSPAPPAGCAAGSWIASERARTVPGPAVAGPIGEHDEAAVLAALTALAEEGPDRAGDARMRPIGPGAPACRWAESCRRDGGLSHAGATRSRVGYAWTAMPASTPMPAPAPDTAGPLPADDPSIFTLDLRGLRRRWATQAEPLADLGRDDDRHGPAGPGARLPAGAAHGARRNSGRGGRPGARRRRRAMGERPDRDPVRPRATTAATGSSRPAGWRSQGRA